MNVSFFLLSESSSFVTTNDNPIHKAAHRSTDRSSILFSDIGALPTNYDNKRLHRAPPSLGCKMVLANAENYEAIYFLTDEEVLDAAACYRSWWEERQYPKTRWTIDPCYDEPLCGSGYRWW